MSALPKNNDKQEDSQLKMLMDDNGMVKTPAYWESTLFSEVYLHNDLKRDFEDHWNKDYEDSVAGKNGEHIKSGFAYFYNEFRNIADTLRRTTKSKNIKETDTISKIIAPLLDALGWYDKCSGGGEEPFSAESSFTVKGKGSEKNKTFRTDMLLVDHPAEAGFINNPKNNDQRKKEARNYCIAPLEAKYWNRISDHKGGFKLDKGREDKTSDDSGKSFSVNEQVLNYMDILNKKWGIATDGNTWRLVHSDISGESTQRCFEFKLESLLSKELKIEEGDSDDKEFLENAKYFYLFFGKSSYIKNDIGKIFLDEVLTESRKYIDTIEEDLKDRFISAMNITCGGFLRVAKENGTIIGKPSDEDLNLIRTVAESHLFNILFIKSCEANNILPTKAPEYYNISLSSIIDRIKVFHPENYFKDKNYITKRLLKSLNKNSYKPEGTNLYKNLIKLTEGLRDGIDKFKITGFIESIFSQEEWKFAKKHHLTDEEMVKILFQLGYSKSEDAYHNDYQKIPYNYFTPRQLGSIYESFLEYKLEIAEDSQVYIFSKKGGRQWVKVTTKVQKSLKGFEPLIHKGQLYFTANNIDRKATGSYYTPDYLVRDIISNTIAPLCKGKNSNEILKIRVCDPAMGSGHFLIGALNFLTKKYIMALESEVSDGDLPSLEQAKRIVLDKCIFGIDLNPRAVKLAKMSLWLESAYSGKKLEKLDDQLKECDSLLNSDWRGTFPKVFPGGFDAIVGNPPYISFYSKQSQKNRFKEELVKYRVIYKYIVPHRVNTVTLFIEAAVKKLISLNGRISFLIDQNFFEPPFKPLREFLVKNFSIELSHSINAFPGVASSQIIINLSKSISNHVKVRSGIVSSLEEIPSFELLEERVTLKSKKHSGVFQKILTGLNEELSADFIAQYGAEIGGKKYSYPHFIFTEKDDKKDFINLLKLTRRDFFSFCNPLTEGFVNFDRKLAIKIRSKYEKLNIALRSRELWNKPKLIMRQSAKNNCATFSKGNIISLLNTFVITHNKDNIFSLKCLLGLLNSKVYSYYFIKGGINRTGEGKQPQIRSSDLNKVKLPTMNTSQKTQIVEEVEGCLTNGKSSEALDLIIYNLFSLSRKDILEVEGFVENYKLKKVA